MEWTKEKPSQNGVYFHRFPELPEDYSCVRVRNEAIAFFGVSGYEEIDDYYDGEWYGPISPPGKGDK